VGMLRLHDRIVIVELLLFFLFISWFNFICFKFFVLYFVLVA
jgi:hypothetical protein